MLRNFRQVFKGNQTPMAVVMMVVLLGMVAYLAPSQGSNDTPDNVFARVYGRDILKRDVDAGMEDAIKRMGKQANMESILPYVRSQVLNRLMQGKLTEELAERHGIVVTDSEIKAALEARLKSIPAFLAGDNQLRASADINAILRDNGTSLKQWEQEISTTLSVRKLFLQAAAQVPVNEPWLNLEYRVRNEKLSFEAVTLAPETAPVADPGTQKLEAFLKQGGARFQAGPRRVVQYVVIEPTFFGSLAPDDAALKAAYDAKKAQYTELKASHILLKVDDAKGGDTLKQAQELRAKLVAGQDFAKTATDLSEDPSAKANKGDLGWFKSGQMDKAFEDAALALKPGEISQPVRTKFGIHLIRLEGRREASFEDKKEELRAQATRQRFASKAKDKLEQLRKRAGERGDLTASARNLGLKLQTSQPLSDESSSAIDGLAGSQVVASEAFRLDVGQVSKIRELGDRLVVFRVQEERPSAVPPLAEIRSKVLEAYKLEEARRIAMDKGQTAIKAGNLGALGTATGTEASTIVSLGELGKHPAIRKALLDTPVGQLTPALWTPEGKLWVARIKVRTPAQPLTFETRHTLVEAIQNEVAEKLLTAELRALDAEGRKHAGLSSFWGRFDGIWINKEAQKRGMEDMPDFSGEQE